MAGNPNPQHTPTDGLGVAAYVQLSGGTGASALSNPSGGTLTHPGSNGANGQGIGATAGSTFPVAQYAITLSLSATGTYETVAVLTAALVDAKDNSYSEVGNFVAKSYNNPSSGSPSWYRPSAYAGYSADVASVVASSTNDATITITALALGHAVIEVEFPTFDNTETGTDGVTEPGIGDMIYCQVLVTVIP